MKSTLIAPVSLALAALAPAQRSASPRSNILELAHGTVLVSVTSSYGGSWTAANLADGSTGTGWSSAQGAAFPHTVVFELPQPYAVASIAVDNSGDQEGSYPGISSRRVTVYGSTTSAAAGFTQLTAFEARRGGRMEGTLGAPMTARWLKFVVSSNWGNAEYTEVMELEAYGQPVAPQPRADVTVPEAALRGLTALRDSGYQAAVAIWTSSWQDPTKRHQAALQLSSDFARVTIQTGETRVRGYEIVRVADQDSRSKRIYALLAYEHFPIYLMLQTTSAGARWDISEIDLNPDITLVFPRDLLEGTPLAAREGQLPDVAVRGFEALRGGHEEVAVGIWTATWPSTIPKERVNDFRARFAQLPQTFGQFKSYEVVGVFEVTAHLRRIYARLDYAQGPVYLMLAAYRSGAQWEILRMEYGRDAKELFPPALLIAGESSAPVLSAMAERAYNAAMKAELRNLVTAEYAFWADSLKYTAKVGPGGLAYSLTEGNQLLSLQLTSDGWTAKVGNVHTQTVCTIYVGSTPSPPATREGEPICQ